MFARIHLPVSSLQRAGFKRSPGSVREQRDVGPGRPCNALLTQGIPFIRASLCLSPSAALSGPFRACGSHLHYILDGQDIHAFLAHCPSPRGEGPERDVRTAGRVLCPPPRSSHTRRGTSFLVSVKPVWCNPPLPRGAGWEGY